MSSINFIGGEKGGVGKSVVARVLAQYFIDNNRPFTGFDTDRSHTSFLRFYEDYASPVVVDSYEGLDSVVEVFDTEDSDQPAPSVIVDMAAQTAKPLARWIKDSDLPGLMAELGHTVNFWHVADGGVDSVSLLDRLIDTYGNSASYIVVKNYGRGSDFSYMEASDAMKRAEAAGASVIALPALHESSMQKVDRQNASFWAAGNNRMGENALGLLERQRVKTWLRSAYVNFDGLPL